ncbi:MAG TPA: TIGR02452 family protein [Ktedonobacterales bacterium]|nr:TIGR02452 family protein [Ktedonobacterales bacterium]
MDAKAIANGTLAALDTGQYTAQDGTTVAIGDLLAACVSGTQCYEPDALDDIYQRVVARPGAYSATTFAVEHETPLQGCARLVARQQYQRIGVLNFASARKPGGGFLAGAVAQEESLARSSGLYLSLRQCSQFYDYHRAQDTSLYSDRMIYSPACPVVRDDAGNWLSRPYMVDFITSPAPNAGAVMRNDPDNRERIVPVLSKRAGKVLALAAYWQCDALVLGAWGCGVFRNDPATVATIFAGYLGVGGAFYQRFHHVLFAVHDRSPGRDTYQAFAARCAHLG